MIKFFRAIRKDLVEKNNTGKYLKYAVGEIVLVVIGILIALQINNWNEHRKELLYEKEILKKFLQDLESDSIFYQKNLRLTISINKLHQELFLISSDKKEEITHENPNYIRRGLDFLPVAKENNPEILNTLIDTEIREAVQIHMRLVSALKTAVIEYETAVSEIRSFLRKNHIHKINAWFEGEMFMGEMDENKMDEKVVKKIVKKEDLVYLANDEDFNQLLFESSLKLNEAKDALVALIRDNTKLLSRIRIFLGE